VVALAEAQGCGLEDMSLDDLTAIDDRITAGVFDVLGVDNSVRSRKSYGGTAPDNVRAQVAAARERFLK
jgi:argininosuccinate lyase